MEDLPKLEDEMKKIIKEDIAIERFEFSPEEARQEMAGQEYKQELIDEHAGNGEKISFYRQGILKTCAQART